MKNLKNKTTYITGGSKGIGLGIAHALKNAGMRVAISGRNPDDLKSAAEALGGGSDVLAIRSDVTDFEQEKKAVEKTLKTFGSLDVLIANAGVGIFESVDKLSLEDWDKMIRTNLTGVFHTLKAGVEALKKSEGYFISIASLAGTNFFEKGAGYNASKFGVVGFTQAAMLDLRKYNIKTTTIMPGSVATYFNHNVPSEKDAWKIQPEDIGQLVLNLLQMNPRTLPSKIEVRPGRPDLK